MILILKRQMIILQAYVPIARMTQGRNRKILFCRKGSETAPGASNKKARQSRAFLHIPENPEWEFGAQKRTRTSTPFRVPAPEAGASTNSAIWATESHVEGPPSGVNRLFEVFATA